MNKTIKKFTVITIILAVLLVAAIVVAAIFSPGLISFDRNSIPSTVIIGTENDIHSGYADVTAYGAVPDDGKDDTSAFMSAAKTGAGIYVPLGTFDIKKTLNLKGQHLKGCGIDRTVIRFDGDGTIVSADGAAMVDDITLTFKELSGKESQGQKVAVLDNGLTEGAIFRSVKLTNVGTGYYAPNAAKINSAVNLEGLQISAFSYKAMEVKASNSMLLRSVVIGEAAGECDTAVSLGGSFTVEALRFASTKVACPLELKEATAATVKILVFDNVKAESGSLIRSISSTISVQTVALKATAADNLVNIADEADGVATSGSVKAIHSDGACPAIDNKGVLRCENGVSQ